MIALNRSHRLLREVHFAGSSMKMISFLRSSVRTTAIITALLLIAIPARLRAQSSGNIEFNAQVAPSGGRPEPVRQLTFYLLRKSIEEVRTEAAQLEPAPD